MEVYSPARSSDWLVEEFATGSGSASRVSCLAGTPAWQWSLLLAGTATLMGLGLGLALRRYSLRLLLAAVLIVGLLGALPPLLLPDTQGRRVRLVVGYAQPLWPGQEKALRAKLDPVAAMATWPVGMREHLEVTDQIVRNLEIKPAYKHDIHDPPIGLIQGTACEFELALDLTDAQCRTLVEFYGWYIQRLGRKFALENGQQQVSGGSFSLGGDWDRWKEEWLEHNLEP
ncbi:MAG: hypothetical protein HS116_19720 [Planctomycetes bacterium]|nr:hypothetical protein [Planctomycetota bacterium]